MSWWTIGGLLLAAAGVIEFVLFRFVLRDRPGIASRMRFLMINAGLNVLAGLALIIVGELS
ncbi:hypothetical protein [Nonomuraea endophytica]|uniref:Uncharacterized protein n=1 Tax=Nonomuraea endophytica TaxID=714136 RepID=A0A7W8EM48_9ACTN|nr:hypothetical protein [Nonomuraea endophytica]MBB5083577.1 hypothetical protein [Nonomuraea endophytica]